MKTHYRATINVHKGVPVSIVAEGDTPIEAMKAAASRLLHRKVDRVHVEIPVRGASTRRVYPAVPTNNGFSLGDRIIMHLDEVSA